MKRLGSAVASALLALAATVPASAQEGGRTLLAVFAHPDDELAASPMLARYAREGVEVYLAIATDGRKGGRPNPDLPPGDSLATVRTREAACAAERLGIHPTTHLGLEDGSLAAPESAERLRAGVEAVVARLRPDVVVTWGPDGGYGHADHRMVSNVVTESYQAGGMPGVRGLYYTATPAGPMRTFPEVTTWVGRWLRTGMKGTDERYLPVRVPYSAEDLDRARRSYACHASQYGPQDLEDVFTLLGHANAGSVYLRPSNGDAAAREGGF